MSQNNTGKARARKPLTPEQRKKLLRRRKINRIKRTLRDNIKFIIPAAAVLVAAIVLLSVVPGKGGRDVVVESEPVAVATDAIESATEVPVATPVPTPVPAQEDAVTWTASGAFEYGEAYAAAALGEVTGPAVKLNHEKAVAADKLDRWPKAEEGFLPTLYTAQKVEEKCICVTVDDCFQASNMNKIVQCALDNDAKLTFFPIGSNLEKSAIAAAVKNAWENGMEIENHTYNHAGMYHYDDDRMRKEIWMQNMKLNEVLGVNYRQHFFRPKGGDERACQRVHAYLSQLGIYGVSVWTQSGSRDSMESLINNLKPGATYLFHTTDNDLNKLLEFIPAAVNRGYKLVTLNEMYGLPANETSELTMNTLTDPPELKPFKVIIPTLKKTMYIRAAAVVQKRLIELGWMTGEADGVYGKSSFEGIGFFQMASGVKADGKAGPSTQKLLFAAGAEEGGADRIKELKRKLGK